MEDVLMRSFWFLILAVVAFVAVGCDTSPQNRLITAASGPELLPTLETTVVPTSTAVAVERALAPVLALNPQPAPQSGQVQISGNGFVPGESISISTGKTANPNSATLPLANAVATADGSFDRITLMLPDGLQSGAHAVRAVGGSSSREASATLWIRAPQPWLVLDSYDAPQYGDLGLVAGGFEPMDQVQVSLQPAVDPHGGGVQLATLSTDQAGNAVWAQVKLPRLAAGTYSMVLHGQANAAELRREVHVTPLKPTVEFSPWAGPPGAPVQLNARGFAPSERITVSLGSAADSTVLQADEYGNLWGAGPVRIPQTAATGSFVLKLLGEDSGATVGQEFKVLEPKPWLELTSWFGAPGAPVGFAGGGWIGGERVSIHVGGATNPVQTSGVADDNGWLKGAGQVYIPNDVEDDVILVAVGEQSHLAAAATFKVVFPFGLRPLRSESQEVPRVKHGG
jgi:hypothetical protein